MSNHTKEFNVELDRLRKIIPGLECSDLTTQRSQFGVFIGQVDNGLTIFAVDSLTAEPEILASRLLDGHITLMNRLYENVVALENITGEQRWIPKES